MAVLVALCTARGAILSGEQLLLQCWGSAESGDSSLHKNIAQLRRILGDSASAPRYIETIRLRGYRAVAVLDFGVAQQTAARPRWSKGSPFRGLLAFDADHADVFFGRDEIIRTLVDVANAQVASGLALLLLLGPSGSGKTSLTQAGLLPALARERTPARLSLVASTSFDLADQGQQSLFTALAGTLLDLQWEDRWAFAGQNAVALGERLAVACASVVAELEAALAAQRKSAPGARFGIFIDRFEALFNAARISDVERAAFLRTLEQLARSDAAVVVLACRNDFYPNIAQYPVLIEAKRHGGHVDLDPPGFPDIAQMIRRPAAAAKLSFGIDPVSGASLDDVLCASAAGRPDALPLLQYCLQELYRLRSDDGELGFAAFHQLGDLEGAIGQRAEQVVLSLDESQRNALNHIMSLLIVLSSDGANVSSQRAPWAALRDDAARQAVITLVENRLFVSDLAGGAPVFGIAHDAILRRWPRMTAWIEAHRNALGARGRLAQHASRWRHEGRPADLLLPRGKLLDEASELQRDGIWSLDAHERELIDASRRRANQRERARMAMLVLVVALALLASSLGVSAMLAKRAAEVRRIEAESLMDFMLGDFADKLRPLGRLDLLESVSSKALPFLSSSDDEDLSPAALTLRARGLQIIGEVSRSRGNPAQALDALNKARATLLRQITMTPRDPQVLKNLGANAYWLARIHKDQNDWPAAEKSLQDYLRFANLLHGYQPDNPEWWLEQSYAHNNLGSLALTRGRPAVAAPQFVASIALKQRALQHMPESAEIAADIADSYSWLASSREALGELAKAGQLYAHELALGYRLRERFPADAAWTYFLAIAYQHRAALGVAQGLDERALRDYEEARRLFTPVVEQDRGNRNWRVELLNLEQERLRILARRTGPAAQLAPLTAIHRELRAILEQDPKNATWARREALTRMRLAAALVASGQAGAGQREAGAAHAALRALHADNPSDLKVRLALIEALLFASTNDAGEIPTRSRVLHCQSAKGMIETEAVASMNHQVLDPWVRINLCLQNHDLADVAIKRLQQIGYRDNSFLRLMKSHQGKEHGT